MARILVVDDDELTRETIELALSDAGHQVLTAPDGAKAFEVLKKDAVDLTVLDRYMPGMSGIDVLEVIRKTPKTARIKVLMCTGADSPKEIDEALNHGADSYALKANMSLLLAKVERVLAAPPRAA